MSTRNRARSPFPHLPAAPDGSLQPDTAQGVPMAAPAPPGQEQITALEHVMRTTNAQTVVMAQLVDYLTGVTEPPEYRAIVFQVGDQLKVDQDDRVSPSLGVYNPDPAVGVWLDITGAGASQRARALWLPPLSTTCFPVKVQRITFGLDAPAAAELVVHTWRYRSLQPLI